MKFLIVISCLVATTLAQRSTYAGSSSKGVPSLHPRFKTDNNDNTNGINQLSSTNVGSRLGETDPNLPLDARGDINLVNRLNEWPKENRPYWLTNHKILEEQRGYFAGRGQGQGQRQDQGVGLGQGQREDQGLGLGQGQRQGQGRGQNFDNRGTMPVQPTLNDRFDGSSPSFNNMPGNRNSFTTVLNGQRRTFVYDSRTDMWVRSL